MLGLLRSRASGGAGRPRLRVRWGDDRGAVEGASDVKRPGEPDFISKGELAFHLGCKTRVIDEWIAKGAFPPPRARPGERHAIWLRRHYRAYRDTGEWPKEAWPEDRV